VVIERLKLDLDACRLHDLVHLAVLLAADELLVLVRKLDLEPDFVVEALDEVQFKHHCHGRPDFLLDAVHLEAHSLEDDLRTSCARDLLEYQRNLVGVEGRRREQWVELNREQPKGCNIVAASLSTEVSLCKGSSRKTTDQLHDRTDCALDVDPVVAEHGEQARRATKGRQLYESGVVVHHGPELVRPIDDHPVELPRQNGRVARNQRFCLSYPSQTLFKCSTEKPTFVIETW
jgi:hypothetical protein